MFASSGEATDPCGVPTSVFDHSPSSDTPAFSHFRIRRSILRSATRCSTNLTSHWWDRLSKKPQTASSIQFTFFRIQPHPQRVQSIVLAAPRPEPIGEAQKVLFVNLIEDRHYGLLDDLVLQSCNTQGTLPSISFRNVGSLGRLRSIRPLMDSAMQVYQLLIQVRLVLLPRHAIYSGRSVPLQRVEAAPQQLGRDVVEQRGEPRPLVPTCCFTHTEQVARRAGPALRPGRGRLPDVLLGRSPSLHALRRSPLFGHFVSTTRPSDSPPTCVLDFWLTAFSNRPVTPSTTGVDGVSRFSRVEFPYMPGVSDCAESGGCWR